MRTKLLVTSLIGAVMALTLTANEGEARGYRAETLADLLISGSGGGELDRNPFDFDMLIQAVIALEDLGGDPDLGGATLLDVLSDPNAEVTVFAPRDRAFRRLARDLGWDRRGGESGALNVILGAFDAATIRDIIKYHVVPGRFGVFRVLRTRTFTTALPGATFTRRGLRLRDNDPDIRDPFLTLPLQLRGGRAIGHTITRILVPVDL